MTSEDGNMPQLLVKWWILENEQQQQQNSKKLDVNKELAMSDVRLEHYGLNKRKVRKTIYNAKNQNNEKV